MLYSDLFAIFNTMNTDTPRTDEALSLHYSEGDYFGEETTKMAYEFARELERELNEMTVKQIELVNHLRLYRGQVNNEAVSSTALFSPTDFKTWWKSEAHHYNLMMGETVFQFAERMAKMAYGQGVIEGMNQQRMGIYPENEK